MDGSIQFTGLLDSARLIYRKVKKKIKICMSLQASLMLFSHMKPFHLLFTEVEVTIQHQKETNFLSSTPSNSSTSDCNLNIYSTTSASSTLELDNIIPSRSGRISAGSYSMGKNTEGGGVCAVGRDKEEPQHEGPNIAASNRDLHKDMDDLTSGLKACNLSVVRRADNGNEDEIVKHFKDLHLREEETITAVPRKVSRETWWFVII